MFQQNTNVFGHLHYIYILPLMIVLVWWMHHWQLWFRTTELHSEHKDTFPSLSHLFSVLCLQHRYHLLLHLPASLSPCYRYHHHHQEHHHNTQDRVSHHIHTTAKECKKIRLWWFYFFLKLIRRIGSGFPNFWIILPFIVCSTVVGLQGVQIQLVPDRGGEVGGLPWHYAEDEIVRAS